VGYGRTEHVDAGWFDGITGEFTPGHFRVVQPSATIAGVEYVGSSLSEGFVGSGSGDVAALNEGNDFANGAEGDDRISGGLGDDSVFGGRGADTLIGDDGSDALYGGFDNDILSGGGGRDTLIGFAGQDRLSGGADIDTARYNFYDQFFFGLPAQTVNLATGRGSGGLAAGDIYISIENAVGFYGADRLIGNQLGNRLDGDAGNDLLVGGLGRDTLIGGLGRDVFDFNSVRESPRGAGRDLVYFRRQDGDKMDLRTIDADNDGTAGNQAFRYIGANAFSGVDGQLRFSGGILQGDTNGDRVPDFEIRVIGALSSSDILL
jgi:Ca2+-binding RTX toxin-like protein